MANLNINIGLHKLYKLLGDDWMNYLSQSS